MQKIYRVTMYENEAGVTIKELVDTTLPEDKLYLSANITELTMPSPYGEVRQQVQYQFKIDATNIGDAYNKWQAASDAAEAAVKKEHERHIVTASAQETKIFTP